MNTQKRIAIIMGRGIEGCGVTKFSIEQASWLKSQGHQVVIFASSDKGWTRKEAHAEAVEIQVFKFATQMDAVIKAVNDQYEYVIINSLPSVGHPEKCIEEFKRFIDEVKVPIVLIQHDHAAQSIWRNAALDEAVKKAKLIFAHSRNNDFSRIADEIRGHGGLASLLGSDAIDIQRFQPAMNFKAVRDRYWKDISEVDQFTHRWIGRTTSWKGYVEMFDFHERYLRPYGATTILEGIDRSPAYLGFKQHGFFHENVHTNPSDYLAEGKTFEKNEAPYVFGPFKNVDMLERMSLSGFGYQLSGLKKKFIERSIEYTHCEVVCCGVIPVFKKSYGDLCTHRKHGIPLAQCKNTGTIWLDENDFTPAYELVKNLTEDRVKRDEWREMAYEFYRDHQDSEFSFKELHDTIDSYLV